ncbi:MAG: uroporphyrinogen-III C-methyltransferase [Gammaproteobacteria bacterium]|nr:uroporphyrinogen-III C-methyltransferase [Gammaproteobacteria bacterium]
MMNEQNHQDVTANPGNKAGANAPGHKPGRSDNASKKGYGGLLAVIIVLLVVLGLAGFGYYRQYLALHAQQNQVSELQKTIRGLDNHPTVVELKQRVLDQDSKLEPALADQNARIAALQQAFEVTQNLINRDQRGWVLAEIEYLMRLAVVRLRLVHDIKGATEALIVADERLGDLADPAMLEVREVLTNEITALKSLNAPDVEGVGLQLMSISNRLYLLPPAKKPAANQLLENEPPLVESGEESFLQRTWSKLARLVGLRRSNAPAVTAVLQAELYYVEQKLRLELEYARQAALRLDKEALNRHLNEARSLIDEHYDRDNQQVITLRAELAALQEADLIPALPNISDSLRKLRELQQKYQPRTPLEPKPVGAPQS